MIWAGIAAFLRDRFNASEILVSLMLVYVAEQVLSYLVYGPWKDPHGYNFPQTITFLDSTRVPRLFDGTRANFGFPMALGLAVISWVMLFRTVAGYRLEVTGLAPRAARYAGFSPRATLWTAFVVSGGMAGLAGALEVAGPVGQLTTHVPLGYGFAGIIAAFVGRLNPIGVVFSSILMSMFTIGGEMSQSRLGIPKSLTGMFEGLLLFSLLASDTLVNYRIRFVSPLAGGAAGASSPSAMASGGSAAAAPIPLGDGPPGAGTSVVSGASAAVTKGIE
jgi:simple sugar transport system permease protein